MQIEKYKGLIRKLIRLLFIVVFELAFMYIWFSDINGLKLQPFENKGNWLMAAVYLVVGGMIRRHLAEEDKA